MVKKIKDIKILRSAHDPAMFKFQSTDSLSVVKETVGQKRAVEAIQFAVRIKNKGFNLYVLGPAGYGKHSAVRQILEQEAKLQAPEWDWCYAYNFENPQSPIALPVDPGKGRQLKQDMTNFVKDLVVTLQEAFGGEEYKELIQKLQKQYDRQQGREFKKLERDAESRSLTIIRNPQGWTVAPVKDGKVLNDRMFKKLSKKEQLVFENEMLDIKHKLEDFIGSDPDLAKSLREDEKNLQAKFARIAIKPIIDGLKKKYNNNQKLEDYFDAVLLDIAENAGLLIQLSAPQEEEAISEGVALPLDPLMRYQINLLVDHGCGKDVPIIYEDNPTYSNLIGRVEYSSQYGTLVTNFSLIKSGALHRANGGYLILDMVQLISNQLSWEGLKRALYAEEIKIESMEKALGLLNTVSLEPEPIPLNIKIVLVGDRMLYYLASELDPQFAELFKVAADFEEEMPRTRQNINVFAKLIGTIAKKEKLLPLRKDAVARVLDESVRDVSDSTKLSTHMRKVTDLLCEANFIAEEDGRRIIRADDIEKALDKQEYRISRVRDELYEQIKRNVLMIDTKGSAVGQINGLTVMQIGSLVLGCPTKITATSRMGDGDIVSIQREVELSGPFHSKGVLIMTGYFTGNYLVDDSLSFDASIVFEQTYGEVDGDSASLAEACVLISSLGNIPIKQDIALTGSITQHGEVQAIGGVNQKIEGFYDICVQKGLTGSQGVMIPESNVQHLMLREDVAKAIAKGEFSLYSVKTVNQAFELLSGLKAGYRNKRGEYTKASFNRIVEDKLKEYAKKAHEDNSHNKDSHKKDTH